MRLEFGCSWAVDTHSAGALVRNATAVCFVGNEFGAEQVGALHRTAQLPPPYVPFGRWWAPGTSVPALSETVAKKEVVRTVMRSGSWITSKGWSSQWPCDVAVTWCPPSLNHHDASVQVPPAVADAACTAPDHSVHPARCSALFDRLGGLPPVVAGARRV